MDKETPQEDAFIREVDEEYRRAQFAALWKRYGRWLLIGIGLGLLLLAAVLFWREHQKREAAKAGEELMQVMGRLDIGDKAALAQVRKMGESAPKGYDVLARLAQAGVAARDGKNAEAVKLYRAIAQDDKAPQPLRDFAHIRALRAGFETIPSATLISELKPYAEPGNPWFAVTGDMLAALYLRDNKPEMAAPLYAAIAKEEGAPSTTRARAAQMAQMLGADPSDIQGKNAEQDQAQ